MWNNNVKEETTQQQFHYEMWNNKHRIEKNEDKKKKNSVEGLGKIIFHKNFISQK